MKKYDHKAVESKWQKVWQKERIYEPDLKNAKNPFYNLMMFPYPSAEGLHVGNMYAFTGSDIYGRFKRMQGHDVFEPIGLDGFGIHSENYALKIGKHPADQAKISEKNFYRQLGMIGNGFAWNEHLETYDPEYYRWTQWIFIQLYKNGLAYRKKSAVNWCPSCLTVLADEQVTGAAPGRGEPRQGRGECERCGTKVIKKELEQWFFKITKYADKLLKGLGPVRSSLAEVQRTRDGIASETSNGIDWSEKVKIAQRNWIGRSEGSSIKFKIQISNLKTTNQNSKLDKYLEVFTTRPDTLFGATFMAVSVELAQKWIEKGWSAGEEVRKYVKEHATSTPNEGRSAEKTGVFTGLNAINPANNKEIPIWVADYVLSGYGSGAVMCVPAHDTRDWEFAVKYQLPIVEVIKPIGDDKIRNPKSEIRNESQISNSNVQDEAYEDEGILTNSGKFDGMDSEKAKWEITKFVGGKKQIQYRLRDWLISRQRYWGPPIPLVFCENCAAKIKNQKSNLKIKEGFNKGELENPGWIAVADRKLPVKLPYIKEFRPTGTNQSPLAADEKFYKTRCPKCGGQARRETDVSDTFLDSAWYYLRYSSSKDKKHAWDQAITKKWCPVDMYIGGAEHSVLHLLYVRFLAMVFKDLRLINFAEPFKKFRAHGLLIKDGAKMSKSKGNVINPDDYIKQYGADALRMYLMFLGPFDQGGDFRDSGIKGITRFLERVWGLSNTLTKKFLISNFQFLNKSQIPNPKQILNSNVQKNLHKTIKKVTEDIENLNYNTAVSALMILLNEFESNQDSIGKKELEIFVKLLAPFAPHMSDEIWQNADLRGSKRGLTQKFKSIHLEPWPKYDPELIKESEVDVVIQISGRVRAIVKVPADSSQAEVERMAKEDANVKKHLSGEIKKVIYVKNKLLNFVV